MPEDLDHTHPPRRPTAAPARGGAKHVYLSEEARTGVQAWADREGVSFSAALDTLARLGLGQDPRDAWSPLLTAKIIGAIRADLGGYRDLLAATALDAGTTLRVAWATAKALRPADYPRIKRLARLEAIASLRRGDALAELGLDDAPESDAAQDAGAGAAPAPGADAETAA